MRLNGAEAGAASGDSDGATGASVFAKILAMVNSFS